MARFTSLEFMEALGLGYFDYNGAKILLRLLSKKGIAKEVGKISLNGRGRPQVVYEIPEEIKISVRPPDVTPKHPPKKKKLKEEGQVTVTQILEAAREQAEIEGDAQSAELLNVATRETEVKYEYDDGYDDD